MSFELVNDISRHKRELSKTRQAFKFPRVSNRKKPSEEARDQRSGLGRDSLDIWTVFNAREAAADAGEPPLDMVAVRGGVAWAGEGDLGQTLAQRINGGGRHSRERFKGYQQNNIYSIAFTWLNQMITFRKEHR